MLESHDYTFTKQEFMDYITKRDWKYNTKMGKAYNRGGQLVARIKVATFNNKEVYYVDYVPI